MDNRSRSSQGARVYGAIRQSLREGEYGPGDRLVESEIAERLQVSRTPVREALGRLEAEGILEAGGGRGLFVRRLDLRDLMDLYAAREIVEGAAARLAATNATASDLEILVDLVEAFARSGGEPTETMRLDRLFHEALCRIAGNRYLTPVLGNMMDTIATLGALFAVAGARWGEALEEHRAIVEALNARDGDAAEALTRQHVRKALRVRLRFLQTA